MVLHHIHDIHNAEVGLSICRNMSSNNLTGGLSSTWGAPGVFPNLVTLDLAENYNLGGILLTQWGTPGSFPKLEVSGSLLSAFQYLCRG